mmetsp:Transcript_115705/g.338420  ORF Transcript_115705/g.338420 Transcript_115705/m.338420 type:complete len:496 (-) Transcript_115705:55-1542(-)
MFGASLLWLLCNFCLRAEGQDLFLAVSPAASPCATPDCNGYVDGPVLANPAAESCQFPRDPNTCPQKIGGECPHYYNNTMQDFDPTWADRLHVEDTLRSFLKHKIDEYLKLVDDCASPTFGAFPSADVFNGVGGRALMHLRLHKLGFQPATSKPYTSHLARAREYIDIAASNSSTISSKFCGFPWGVASVHTLAAIIYDLEGNAESSLGFVAKVREAFNHAADDEFCVYDDWDAGRAGLLYAAALLDHHFGKTMINRDLVVRVANATVERGSRLGAAAGVDYMKFISPNDGGSWVGMSHGAAGVLYGLLAYAPELLGDPVAKARIVKTMDFIVSTQQASGNFPTEYYTPEDDVLVQWDHGAPGVSATLLVASKAIPEASDKWVASATKALDVVWKRGLLTKGLMLCHGIGGNIYMQLLAAKLTGKKMYLHRALQFVRFVSEHAVLHEVEQMRVVTPSPFLFWIGSWESAIMWASDLVAHANEPGHSAMPMFELTF